MSAGIRTDTNLTVYSIDIGGRLRLCTSLPRGAQERIDARAPIHARRRCRDARPAETVRWKGGVRTSFFDFARAPILNIMRVYGASTHYTRLPVPPIVPVNPVQPGPHACDETSRSDGS